MTYRIIKGSSRWVILTNKWAIKIPSLYSYRMFLIGLLANMQEVLFSMTNDVRLCPIYFYIIGGFCVVMPRVEPISDEDYSITDLKMFCNNGDMIIPVELKYNSFGLLRGKLVAIDFG